MAEYTIELRKIIENGIDIFDFNYPFYDESKRAKFQEDFKRHFYFREIGTETVDRFKWEMQDVFANIFPYYNKLFEAAQIEYSVLDNYKLTETTTIQRENIGRTGSVSSTVGQAFDDTETNTDYDRTAKTTETGDMTGNVTGNIIGTATGSKTATTDTDTTGTSETAESGTSKTTSAGSVKTMTEDTSTTTTSNTSEVKGSETKTTTENGTSSNESTEKFLDTPQGLTNIADSKYLTTLKGIDSSGTTHNESNDRITTETDTTATGTSETTANGSVQTITGSDTEGETTGNSKTDTTGNSLTEYQESTTANSTTDSEEDTKLQHETITDEIENADTKVTHIGEHKTTADNNTRTESKGSQSETLQTVRSGNIGVDTDADMIQKHIKLQQVLMNIQKMFFDECEVLFMGVY